MVNVVYHVDAGIDHVGFELHLVGLGAQRRAAPRLYCTSTAPARLKSKIGCTENGAISYPGAHHIGERRVLGAPTSGIQGKVSGFFTLSRGVKTALTF